MGLDLSFEIRNKLICPCCGKYLPGYGELIGAPHYISSSAWYYLCELDFVKKLREDPEHDSAVLTVEEIHQLHEALLKDNKYSDASRVLSCYLDLNSDNLELVFDISH